MIEKYKNLDFPLPKKTWSWNMYGAGVENIGAEGKPELEDVKQPADNQLLVRVDSVGMCFSDVKLIQQGGKHPKLYNRDLRKQPTRLGHEAALTVLKVGKELQDQYQPGQRLAIQPDIYQDQMSTAYGYTIPGGLTQFHLIGPEVLDADDGAYVLPVEEEMGYAETALTEPWACVEAAYTQRRRLTPLSGGSMWIIGRPGDETQYSFAQGLQAPDMIVISDLPASLEAAVKQRKEGGASVIEKKGLAVGDIDAFVAEVTHKHGFDDIVILDPRSAEFVSAVARHIAYRGTINLVGTHPLDGNADIDVGRVHYHYTAYLGNPGPDIDASYGEERNRSELADGGTAVFVGAGGPMGQMHVQRAIETSGGPSKIIVTEVNAERLQVLDERFGPMAKQHGKQLFAFNPKESEQTLKAFVEELTGGEGADDVVVSVPVVPLIEEAGTYLGQNGMLVLFAGVPNGNYGKLDISNIYLHNAQLTGTSGSRLADQRSIIDKALAHQLSPSRAVAAVGGMQAAREGVEAMMTGRYAGKVVIFPQLHDLPLMGLEELDKELPEVAEKLSPEGAWTKDAEEALFAHYWTPNEE